MFTRNLYVGAAILAGLALIINLTPWFSKEDVSQRDNKPNGRNNTVLFLSNSESGLTNVLLATSYALLVNHNEIQVHFATFGRRHDDISKISKLAAQTMPSVQPITFHKLDGQTYGDALQEQGHLVADAIHSPGVHGSTKLCKNIQAYLMPWSGSEYFSIYKQISEIIDQVDPSVIAVDPLFGPGLDATRDQNRRNAIISPNSCIILKKTLSD